MGAKSLLVGAGGWLMVMGLGCIPEQPGDSTPPPAVPHRLIITGRGQVPPNYTLRWEAPEGVAVDFYNVFRSTQPITPENRAAALLASATDRDLVIEIQPNTGVQFFRVSAVDLDGVETPLSAEFALDTTARAAFRADIIADETFELFTVPLAGGVPAAASGVVLAGRSVDAYSWSPDGRRIAFIADRDVAGQRELYVSDTSGAASPLRVSGASVSWAHVVAFAWSPDARHIAFVADRITDEVYDLFIVDIDTVSPRLITPLRLRQTGYDGVRQFAWSPDGSRLAFVSDAISDNLFELFTVNVRNSVVRRASAALVAQGAPLDGVSDFAWSPDSSTLAYLANATFLNTQELFVVPAIGGAVLNLSAPLASGGSVRAMAWSPDGSRIAFTADRDVPGAVQLYVTPPDTSLPVPVSGPATPQTAVTEFAWSRDAQTLAFQGDVETPGLPGLYAVDADGSNLRRISGALVSTTTIRPGWRWSPNARQVGFLGTTEIRPSQELLVAAADGSGITPGIPPLINERAVTAFDWSADGSQLIYISDQDLDEQFALYLAPPDAELGVSTRLDQFLPLEGDVTHAVTSPLCSEDVPMGARVAVGVGL